MTPEQSLALTAEEIQAAIEFTAHISADALQNRELTPKERLRALGDYLICCSIAGPVTNPALGERFTQGLIAAGVPQDVAQTLRDPFTTTYGSRAWRVNTLAHIPAEEEVRGIKRSARQGKHRMQYSVSINPAEFVRGILERKQQVT